MLIYLLQILLFDVLVPVGPHYGPWKLFVTTCAEACGGSVKAEYNRVCDNPPPTSDEESCYGASEVMTECNMDPCPPGYGNCTT